MAIKSETELYQPVKRLFEERGYAVKSEVNHCDLVAYRDGEPEPVIVELKKTFNLQLIFQVLDRLKLSGTVYAAVEYDPKRRVSTSFSWNDAIRLCHKLGIGLIGVQFYKRKAPAVDILCQPGAEQNITGRKSAVRAKRLKNEFDKRSGDYNTGGSNGTKLVTAYRERALLCAFHLSQHESLSPRELRGMLKDRNVADLLQKNYYGWYERIERGRYRITEKGRAALDQYRTIVSSLSAHLD